MAKRRNGRRSVVRRESTTPPKIPVLYTYYDLKPAHQFKDDTAGEMSVHGRTHEIRIADSQDEPQIWSATFWHEWFHAAFNELGYVRDSAHEAKVEGLAHAMMGMITDPHGRQLLELMLKNIPVRKA